MQNYSVLMSVYYKENAKYLKESIESMLKQTVITNDFVIIEDGTLTSELENVILFYEKKYKNIFHVIRNKNNKGLGLALREGILSCKNELIARMDSDDYSIPTRIEKELKILNQKELDMVGSNVLEFIDELNNIQSKVKLPETNDEIVKYSKKRNPMRHPTILYRKSSVLKSGNYKECYLCEDYDLWIRMIKNQCKIYNIQENLVYMRINKDFYKRRGGIKYLKSIYKFKKYQFDTGYYTLFEFLKTMIPHAIVCLLPNEIRDWVYKKMLRK